MENKKISVKTLYLLGAIAVGLIGLGVGSTFAMFTASDSINDAITIVANLSSTDEVIDTKEIVIPSKETKKVIFNVSNNTNNTLNYATWYLNNTEGIKIGYLETGANAVGTIEAGTIENIIIAIKNNNSEEITVTVGVLSGVGSVVVGDNMSVISAVFGDRVTAAEYISNLYNDASKTQVSNNGIAYNYATSVDLMNDRLGGVAGFDAGNIRYYGANPNNYIDIGDGVENLGVWMYLGFDEVSNRQECLYAAPLLLEQNYDQYCSDYESLGLPDEATCRAYVGEMLLQEFAPLGESFGVTVSTIEGAIDFICSTVEMPKLWRIIGVFDGKLKIIRDRSIGYYSWDNKDTTTGAESDYGKNDWTTARLMKLLNPNDYYSVDINDEGYGQSLYWNQESGTCFRDENNATKGCDFTSSGLSNTARRRVAEVTWNLGGLDTNYEIYSNQIYGYERGSNVFEGRPTIWTGKVGLMYPSDYGYATDFGLCSSDLDNYNDENDGCAVNDWLVDQVNWQWMITPGSLSSSVALKVNPDGYVSAWGSVYVGGPVRPVLYLTSNQEIIGGDGTVDNPYRLGA